jgi:hypothetical protein
VGAPLGRLYVVGPRLVFVLLLLPFFLFFSFLFFFFKGKFLGGRHQVERRVTVVAHTYERRPCLFVVAQP